MSESLSLPKEKQLTAAHYQHLEGDIHKISYQEASRQSVKDIFSLLDDIREHYATLENASKLKIGILFDNSQAPPLPIVQLITQVRLFNQRWKLTKDGSLRPDSRIRICVIYDHQSDSTIHNWFANLFISLRWKQFEIRYFKSYEQEEAMAWLRYQDQ